MKANNHIYALLIGVGDYADLNQPNLLTYKMDLAIMESALISGLKVPGDQIRIMSGEHHNGYVKSADFARTLSSFSKSQTSENAFFLYFSGHGDGGSILLSDAKISLQSVVDYAAAMPAKTKILIFDCCYSGGFQKPAAIQWDIQVPMSDFLGSGLAIFASSAENEPARLDENAHHSIFTEALAASIVSNPRIHKGMLSVDSIGMDVQERIRSWNHAHPDKVQHAIYRSSIGGDAAFQVADDLEYRPHEISYETADYIVERVEPLSTARVKRLCVFVIFKKNAEARDAARYTKEIAERVKCEPVYASRESEKRFGRSPAKAVWCYFGRDSSDLVNHLHVGYGIWCNDPELRKIYFKNIRNSCVISDIYFWENRSYRMLKGMQKCEMSREDYIEINKRLLAEMISLAEAFIGDLREVYNSCGMPSECAGSRSAGEVRADVGSRPCGEVVEAVVGNRPRGEVGEAAVGSRSCGEVRAADRGSRSPSEWSGLNCESEAFAALREKYGTWRKTIRILYFDISELDPPPDDLHDWAEEIMNLAGWLLDLALILDGEIGGPERGSLDRAVVRYQRSLLRIAGLEPG